jgi:cyclophilin family peptidyl-prolyl cis-trans isomerase
MEPSKPKGLLFSIIGVVGLAIIIILAVTLKKPAQAPSDVSMQPLETTTTSSDAQSLPTTATTADTNKKIMDIVTLKTNMGDMTIQLDRAHAPKTVENFITLAQKGFYDGVRFHRVIKGFMIQTGDPNSKDTSKKQIWGTGGPGYSFADELTGNEKYPQGTVAMANAGPNTNGSQFFIVTANPAAQLTPDYTVFGKITKGMDVALKIENVKTEMPDRPIDDVIIQKVTVE